MAYTKNLPPSWSYVTPGGTTITYNATSGTESESTGICSGHTEGVNVGTASCVGHRSTCSANKTNFTDNTGNGYTLAAGWAVRAQHINDLRATIAAELVSRNNHKDFSYSTSIPGNNSSGSNEESVLLVDLQNVEDALDRMTSNTPIPESGTDVDIVASPISDLRSKIRDLEADCLCNSDCACNSVCTCNTDCRCNYSDRSLKKDIEPLELGLEYLKGLGTYKFKYIEDEKQSHYGVMAQELKDEVLVSEDKKGKLMVSYIEIIPILINAVKELSERVNGK
jgi:hypothetical protein